MVWIVSLTTSAAMPCAGWQGSPSQRAACCRAADHDCTHHGQKAADDCCAKSEQGRQQGTVVKAGSAASAPLAPAAVVLFAPFALPPAPSMPIAIVRAYDDAPPPTPHDSPQLVFSVFRI